MEIIPCGASQPTTYRTMGQNSDYSRSTSRCTIMGKFTSLYFRILKYAASKCRVVVKLIGVHSYPWYRRERGHVFPWRYRELDSAAYFSLKCSDDEAPSSLAASSAGLYTPSFCLIERRCTSTVRGEMPIASPISLLV